MTTEIESLEIGQKITVEKVANINSWRSMFSQWKLKNPGKTFKTKTEWVPVKDSNPPVNKANVIITRTA